MSEQDSPLPKKLPKEETHFAPAHRLGYEDLAAQMRRSLDDPCVKLVLDAVDGYVMILNQERQILAANHELLDGLQKQDPNYIIGLRPGEAFNCIHFTEGPGGCGTSEHCSTCGAVLATLATQHDGEPATSECHISMYNDGKLEARDFRVRCAPLAINGSTLITFVLHDISSQKRREVLEETFLHDMLNAVGGIEGWSDLLRQMDDGAVAKEILSLATSLKEGIVSQRALLDAEKGLLVVHKRPCDAAQVLNRLRTLFEVHPAALGKKLDIEPPSKQASFDCDLPLLLRVLINMVKNALEAVPPEGMVRVWFEVVDGKPTFKVNNPGVINAETKMRIFERSFSTKAERGRGLGTYAMKLFGERYLGGSVQFESDKKNGTTFWISLPDSIAKGKSKTSAAGHSRSRRVLFVEDEESLRRLGELFLERLGFSVTSCANATDALALFTAAPGNFDLCLTDFCMKGMNGLELGRRLTALRPDLPVILTTGFGDNLDGEWQKHAKALLRKPFALQELASVLDNFAA